GLHVGAWGWGVLSAAEGVGSLAAALWLAGSSRRPTIPGVLAATVAFGLLEVGFALSRLFPLSLALLAGLSAAELIFAALAMTMLQAIAPDHLRGRVMSVAILSFDGSVPIGYLLMGWLSGHWGAPNALLIGALLGLAVAGVGWLARRPAEASAGELLRSPRPSGRRRGGTSATGSGTTQPGTTEAG
ncbi:MAG: MFS transporter, partial [Thermomicrobiaceae bacterium]|nr:MFS transporter [Thermomicrobiaceae bacterium]